LLPGLKHHPLKTGSAVEVPGA